jgi:hypothetical protein
VRAAGEVVREIFLFIRKDHFDVFGQQPIAIKDTLFKSYIFSAPQFAKTPDTKIKSLLKIKRGLRVQD